MSGPEFFQTGYGKRFFDGQLPQLIKAIEGLGKAANQLIKYVDEINLTNVQVDGEKIGEFVRGVVHEEIEANK
jgi:hypothetical protein